MFGSVEQTGWRCDGGSTLRLFTLCICLGAASIPAVADEELPGTLTRALDASRDPQPAAAAVGVLRRYANADQAEARLHSRTALARLDREAGHLNRAASWVEDYAMPVTENYQWPRIAAFIEDANIRFERGQTFDALKRLTTAKEESRGLGRIAAQRALSVISQQQPDLEKALQFEKEALETGNRYFKRKKISETAGLEAAKPGHQLWTEWRPGIEERIEALNRMLAIESYGLDFVLYREAQEYRKADHPLAMDFTNVAAAFDPGEPMVNKVPGADYKKALEIYTLLSESFQQNPYAEAAKLYSAVCRVHMGDANRAIRDLKAFYKENPAGLYRGEALKIIGDIYLFHKWDQGNAEEAYKRAVNWCEAVGEQSRVLETYLVPEKSVKVSKPPKKIKMLTEEGRIVYTVVPSDALINRTTSEWYVGYLRVDVEWRRGFLDILSDEWDAAMEHFEQVKRHDNVIKKAETKNVFNAYHRLKAAKIHEVLVATPEQLKGLKGKVRNVVMWADLNFLIENFQTARSLYSEIASRGRAENDEDAYARGVLGKMLAKREMEGIDGMKDVKFMHEFVSDNPDNNSAPVLLEICATFTEGEPLDRGGFLKKIYTDYPKSTYARDARYYEVLHVPELHELDRRRNMIKEFKNDFPNATELHRNLDDYYVWFVEQLEEQNKALEGYQ